MGNADAFTGTPEAGGNAQRRTIRRREWKFTAPLFVVAAFALGALVGATAIPGWCGALLGLLTGGCYAAVSD